MLEDFVFCSEANASCVSEELKKMGFAVVPEEVSVGDRQIVNKISPIKKVTKLRISRGPWGTLMRASGKIKTIKGLNFYNPYRKTQNKVQI